MLENLTQHSDDVLSAQELLESNVAQRVRSTEFDSYESLKRLDPNLAFTIAVQATWATVNDTEASFGDVLGALLELTDEDRQVLNLLNRDTPQVDRNQALLEFVDRNPELAPPDNVEPTPGLLRSE